MKKNWFYLLSAFLVMSLLVPTAEARREKRGGWGKKAQENLNLTEEQSAQMKALRKSHKEELKPLRDSRKQLREKMQAAMKNDAAESELKSIHSEQQKVRSQIAEKKFAHRLEVRKILTKEQRQKMEESRSERRGQRKARRKGRMMGDDDEDEEDDDDDV